jgi:two-component system, response regulator YesN
MQNSGMENGQNLSVTDSRVKVLVVDDHPNTATMLARAISRLGSNVDAIAATNGHDAIRHAEEKAADILITDMMMPEMTGLKLIETLNEKSLSPAVSFLLTAHDSDELREMALQTNVKQVISKPASPELVCEIIQQTMDELKRSKMENLDSYQSNISNDHVKQEME